jgi:hypothetical protein
METHCESTCQKRDRRPGIQNEPTRLIFVGGGQEELEAHLADAPAASWEEAADKVRRTLVEAVLEDLERLASARHPRAGSRNGRPSRARRSGIASAAQCVALAASRAPIWGTIGNPAGGLPLMHAAVATSCRHRSGRAVSDGL